MESDLLDQMLSLLMQHCGEEGDNEGAYETLERLILERKEARDLLKEIWESIPAEHEGPRVELHALILNKIPMMLATHQGQDE